MENLPSLFPKKLSTDVLEVIKHMPESEMMPVWYETKAELNNESVYVGCRIYNDFIIDKDFEKLNNIQKNIAYCLYTKHHDGYLREKCLQKIIQASEDWIPPFVFHLLGEHVPNITEKIYSYRDILFNHKSYVGFISENLDYAQLIRQKCVSYWNEYNREKYPSLDSYPGILFIDHYTGLFEE